MLRVRRSVFIFCCLFLASCGGDSKISVRTPNASAEIKPKIINGSPVSFEVSPQIVRLDILRLTGEVGLCSGTVLSNTAILTAGHCLPGDTVAVNIVAGNSTIPAKSLEIHPGYLESESAIFNDVAIVTADSLGLPALPIITSQPITQDSAIIAYGYGLDENEEFGALKSGETSAAIITENHIFAPPFFGDGTNPCFGDSGGPAVQWYNDDAGQLVVGLVGVVSSGTTENCYDGDATLFANLQNPGILQFVQESVPDLTIR